MSMWITAQVPGTPYIVPAYNLIQPTICTESNTQGMNFWVCFGNNYGMTAQQVYLGLRISAESASNITLFFNQTGQYAYYSVAANSVLSIDLSNITGLGDRRSAVYLGAASGTFNQTLHITSDNPVSVYAFNTCTATTDATIVLPVSAWGSDYYRLSYTPYNGYYDAEMIIANENNTLINGTITLNMGQVYYLLSTSDMTGRHVTSNKPVAYFSHNTIAQVPTTRVAADILFEQMMSVDRWGKKFLVPNAPEDNISENNHIRIIASAANTIVKYSGATWYGGVNIPSAGGTLNAGQWTELKISGTYLNGSCYIEASEPVGVASYMVGPNSELTQAGDPSIAWIPPLNQSVRSAIISPFIFSFNSNMYTNLDQVTGNSVPQHYMIIIVPTDSKNQTSVLVGGITYNLDGVSSLPSPNIPSAWVQNVDSDYSYYIWTFNTPLSVGVTGDLGKSFKITNPDGVIVLAGGIGHYESYYYNAGSGTCIVNP